MEPHKEGVMMIEFDRNPVEIIEELKKERDAWQEIAKTYQSVARQYEKALIEYVWGVKLNDA